MEFRKCVDNERCSVYVQYHVHQGISLELRPVQYTDSFPLKCECYLCLHY